MHTETRITIQGDIDRIFALASAVEDWPRWLPHYRWVHVLSGDHTYSVTATNAAGLESLRSAPGTGRVLPNSPTGTTIKISAAVQSAPDVGGPWTDLALLDLPAISVTSPAGFYRAVLTVGQ